jgi:tRNA(Ile)-lysidine synthase
VRPSPGHLWPVGAASLRDRVRAHVARSRLLDEPGLAVLAVSGGGDSLAMLDLVAGLAAEWRLRVLVAHADHGILPGSAAVAARVAELARERYGVEAVTAALSLGPGASETRARLARYRFLRAVQAEREARYLLTAHHADDQAETVLLRVLRGSAPSGLRGIDAVGPRGLVRPLLPFRKAELVAHALAAGLPVVQDPSNEDPRHLRAWVRGVWLPAAAQRVGPEAVQGLLAVARHASSELAAWESVLDHLPGLAPVVAPGRFEVARGVLRDYDNMLGARILRAVARRAGIPLRPAAAARLARFAAKAPSGRRLAVGAGLVAEASFGALIVACEAPGPAPRSLDGTAGALVFGRFHLAWRNEATPATLPREGWTTWLPGGSLAVRAARPGERLVPLGGVGRRKVSRLLMEARVPRADRASYPVVTSGDAAAWIPGVCRGSASVPHPGSEAVRIDARVG